MLAIGKESVSVRIAELTAGSEAILFACRRVAERDKPVLLGSANIVEHRVYFCSLIGAEHYVRGFAMDVEDVLRKVKLTETLSPCERGFRALRIKPKSHKEGYRG